MFISFRLLLPGNEMNLYQTLEVSLYKLSFSKRIVNNNFVLVTYTGKKPLKRKMFLTDIY